ncbi:uncharacterized protein Z518_10314 [Rhinocladiella mackenziei CBS 650.93]|uniref:Uncharacterized protein n=1 Tax=Rhinocladiella mackenziei CBS 650.93 TaxID=1442369 RepID=A0A0D2IAA2_9EURO|nr:uncharacterized protein Z518_10314 [Rhinocladiella mackenziei CBS 650.93]KIX00176.1 hypothetical protein Z518_10314 [Rhinocladiella mackenziei CBS 650.93]
MSANSGSGGVRNLRAMFENKVSDQSTSPPSRGRSPNPSELSSSSRPVSKVRTSFVAVERPGENGGPPILGLRRTSEVSSLGEIKESTTVDTGNIEKMPSNTETRKDENPIAVPEKKPSVENSIEGGLGNILKGSAFVENTPSKPPSEARKLGDALSSGQAQEKIARSPSKSKDETKAASMVEKMRGDGEKQDPPPSTTLQTTKTAQPVKAPPTRQTVAKPAPKSPVVSKPSSKTPTSPAAHLKGGAAKIKGVMESAKEAQHSREVTKQNAAKTVQVQAEKAQSSAPKLDTQSKTKPAPEAVKKEKTPTSPHVVRSPKAVKPKSPTKPGKLPAAATATTASSVAKSDMHPSPTESEFRKSVTKKPSAISIRQPRVSTSSTTSTLAKKSSRASLTNGHDRPKSRVSASKPDEGFLARMMRPTASSAQKVHDKLQINSPPKPRPASANQIKHIVKQKAPPKMHLEASAETGGENTENGEEQSILPEESTSSPHEAVKEDAMKAEAEKEPIPSEPNEVVEQVNGTATATPQE